MKQNHLLSIADLNGDEILSLISNAVNLKKKIWTETLKHKSLAILFEKQSARTRVSFDLAMNQLGGHAIYLSQAEVGLGTRESVPDVARVLGRYVDAHAVVLDGVVDEQVIVRRSEVETGPAIAANYAVSHFSVAHMMEADTC